jgi:hypothetical protein
MKRTRKQKKPVSAENIALLADEGKDVSPFFTNAGRMMGPIQWGECRLRVANAGRARQRGKAS